MCQAMTRPGILRAPRTIPSVVSEMVPRLTSSLALRPLVAQIPAQATQTPEAQAQVARADPVLIPLAILLLSQTPPVAPLPPATPLAPHALRPILISTLLSRTPRPRARSVLNVILRVVLLPRRAHWLATLSRSRIDDTMPVGGRSRSCHPINVLFRLTQLIPAIDFHVHCCATLSLVQAVQVEASLMFYPPPFPTFCIVLLVYC